jgi:hypothetical protein
VEIILPNAPIIIAPAGLIIIPLAILIIIPPAIVEFIRSVILNILLTKELKENVANKEAIKARIVFITISLV